MDEYFKLEKQLHDEGYELVIGIDEAGRGPLAGPVVACAAALKSMEWTEDSVRHIKFIRDSKTLSEKQRERMFQIIQDNFYVGVGICDHETIDRINILEASFLAMKKAMALLVRGLEKENVNPRSITLVDGNKTIPNFSGEQKAVVGGDSLVRTISAASIIAKVTRDRIMRSMHDRFPEYGFDKHKGYGTRLHMEKISQLGPCDIHRKSFRPFID